VDVCRRDVLILIYMRLGSSLYPAGFIPGVHIYFVLFLLICELHLVNLQVAQFI
jgi:hypothetical protein